MIFAADRRALSGFVINDTLRAQKKTKIQSNFLIVYPALRSPTLFGEGALRPPSIQGSKPTNPYNVAMIVIGFCYQDHQNRFQNANQSVCTLHPSMITLEHQRYSSWPSSGLAWNPTFLFLSVVFIIDLFFLYFWLIGRNRHLFRHE